MANFIERNQQRKEKRVNILLRFDGCITVRCPKTPVPFLVGPTRFPTSLSVIARSGIEGVGWKVRIAWLTGCGSFGSWATATWVETAEHHFDRPRLYGLRPFDGYHFLGYLEGLTNYVYKQSNKIGWNLAWQAGNGCFASSIYSIFYGE